MAHTVTTRNKFDDALYKGIGDTFNYGSLHFDGSRQPFINDPKELAKAFAYFNRTVDRLALQKNYQATVKAISDGRHPVADVPFIKVGSYMTMKLAEKQGAARAGVYHTMGPLTFFDDYIKLYKSNRKHPKALRFNKPFEQIVTKWNQDWGRTWNEQTRKLTIANEAELVESGEQLKKSFAGAEVYPDFLDQLLRIKQGPGSVKAVKLAVELYPQSARANLVWGLFLVLLSGSDIDKAKLEKTVVEKEPPLTYLKRSLEIDPDGPANAGSLRQVARGWMGEGRTVEDAERLLKLAIQLHPQSGTLYEGLGDVYAKQGRNDEAIGSYKKALELDPTLQPAKEALKKLSP
jgi:tetratricopeptide (TPR) repeat protein